MDENQPGGDLIQNYYNDEPHVSTQQSEHDQSTGTVICNSDPEEPSQSVNLEPHVTSQDDSDSDSDIEIVEVTPAVATISQSQHQQQDVNDNASQSTANASQPRPQQQASGQPPIHHQNHAPNQQSQARGQARGQAQGQAQGGGIQERMPYWVSSLADYEPTWEELWPEPKRTTPAPMMRHTDETRAYRLSLLSNTEFTITAITHYSNSFDFQPTLFGLRKPIKEITRTHASKHEKAVMEEGRWRVPLSVYQVFLTYLNHEQNTIVYPIPADQIKIASLGKAAAERGYPSPDELIENGVPVGLANALAPYQRGGVDFVMQRGGRALIADEMGLGKTVQGIAAMACFGDEWPLLVLSPSTARYHWEAEFIHWLGKESAVNQAKVNGDGDDEEEEDLVDGGEFRFEEEKKVGEGFEKVVEISGSENSNSAPNKRKGDSDSAPNAKKKRSRETMELLSPSEINVLTTSSDVILKPGTKVVVVSYGLIPNLIKKNALFPGQFKCIIVDESHMLKNKKSKRTMSVMPLLKEASRVIMLSGTPAMSKAEELFPQLNALGAHKGWWDDEEDFNAKYVKDKYSDPSFQELHTLLTATVMIRRLKNDILKDMPKKMRENVFVDVRCPDIKDQIAEALFQLRSGKGVLGKLSVLHQTDLKMSERGTRRLENKEAKADFGQGNNNDPSMANANMAPTGLGGEEAKVNRKAALNKVFQLTGKSKIPILIDMLKRWLEDSTNGKLCIFAHHIAVLDALVQGGELSNAPGSNSKFIRIDGSTNPRFRQDQITEFQNDPSVRVAVLGITAAGVGVTLTAASTIWFAELFWTPALLIQAEDRCHRIGQQARVRCLYTIAKGTLDEVLWILLKRKFQALGEFVEGKEMMDMVVHNSYNNEFDAVDRKCDKDKVDDDDDDDRDEQDDAFALANEGSIQHDIEELAKEDIAGPATSDDDCSGNEDPSNANQKKRNTLSSSGNNVICLLDDDEDVTAVETILVDAPIEQVLQQYKKDKQTFPLQTTTKILGMKYFYMFWLGQRYDLHFVPFHGRIIVSSQRKEEPKFASIVIAINNWVVPIGSDFTQVIHVLKDSLKTPPVRLMFGHDENFSQLVGVWWEEQRKQVTKSREKTSVPAPVSTSSPHPTTQESAPTPQKVAAQETKNPPNHTENDIIELLDD